MNLRCVICGRWMGVNDEMVNLAFEGAYDLDPAEPEMAHKECAEKDS